MDTRGYFHKNMQSYWNHIFWTDSSEPNKMDLTLNRKKSERQCILGRIWFTPIRTRYNGYICSRCCRPSGKQRLCCQSISNWTKCWHIKLNETKSVHINFTNKREQQVPININFAQISYANSAKCLGITLEARLRW